MPYASSIQVVNDANGVAHGFLADNGAIWQCQWDPQAQVWNQGQLVPQAFGGEKLQALYLDQLWPASSGNPEGLSPGIVLAYRIGEGRSAEIFASFGQWGSNGELGWSLPLQLTQDQLDEVAFSLVPAEEAVGGFSLVVQKRQADTPAGTLLDQLGSASSEELPAKLEATLSGSRPDSDLYVTQFNLEVSESPSAWAELSIPGTTFSESITAAPSPVIIAAAPAPFAGNTQLSRQQLSANATQPPSTALMSSSLEGTSGGDDDKQSANYSGALAHTWSKGGQWRTGMISGSNLTSWGLETPFKNPFKANDAAGETESALDAGSSNHFRPQFRWDGSFGIRNIGAGLTSVNTMKMSAGVGNDNKEKSDRWKAIAKNGGSDVTGYVGLGGMLYSEYSYQGSGGLIANISLNPSQKLQQILTQESVGIDSMLRLRSIAPGGNSAKLIVSEFIGYMWSQQVTNNGDIPSWIADLGYYSGMVGNAEKMGKAGYGVLKGGYAGWIKYSDWRGNVPSRRPPKTAGQMAEMEENTGIGDQSKKGFEILNWVNAFYGTALAITNPIALASIKGVEMQKSSGIQNETEMILRVLWHSVVGLELKISNILQKFLTGAEKGSLNDYLYIAAGGALPLGGFMPWISYYHSFSSGAQSTDTVDYSSEEGVYPSSTTQEGTSTSTTAYIPAPSGNAYPFTYGPSSANNIYLDTSDQSSQSIPLASPGAVAGLKKLTLNTYQLGLHSISANPSDSLPLTLVNAGTGLKDGTYTNVAILGVTISGGLKDAALAGFTVSGGSINPESFKITRSGNYLALPEASSTSPASYALLLDVFTTGIANPPNPSNAAGGNPFANLPLITVAAGASNSPLAIQSIQSVQTVSVLPASQPAGVVYPEYDPKTKSTQPQPANNNATYIYSDVAVNLLNAATQQRIEPLNPGVTATVYLNAGLIQQVVLSQPLLFSADSGSSAGASNSFSIQLQLPPAVVASLPANTAQPSYVVSPQSLALNNFVEDDQFSGQSGAANAGVYLSAGLSDQLPLYSSMGKWPVQNRVTYVAASANGQPTFVYLNGLLKSAGGGFAPEPATTAADLSLSEIYSNHDILFTAASTPTAATIAGPASTAYANKTFVAWVEASNPVIPISTASGAENFQAYMDAFYGDQRINYRINTSGSTWLAPDLKDLYHPDGAIINHLQAVNVADPAAAGQERTLLVWSETSIAAIKEQVQSFGSSGSTTAPIPTTLKVAWLNPNPKSYQWNDLFADANGNSTIQTIPWNPTKDVGLGIDDISVASLPLLSAGAANGALIESPVISWSQDVRTPYTQSVLNDKPAIYLKFDQLQAGVSAINIGTVKNSSTTATSASATGLNFAIQGALPASQATAVQNSDGTGVLATGMGTINRSVSQILDNIPADDLNDTPDPIALFTGSITGTLLTVTSLSQGSLAVGDVISGDGIAAGTIITAITPGNPSNGTGSYTLNISQPQPVTSTSLISTPNVGVCSFTGSIVGTELTVNSLTQGNLHVGDVISGQGIADGTIITAINPNNPSNGTGLFTVNKSQTETISSAGLVASPGLPTVPYTIEFWAQLQPGSNPGGAGLVALGQPSDGAIGFPTLPEGWLLTSSFVVDQITWNEAAARGLIESVPSSVTDPGEAIYGWGWAVLAEGANTTAMNGNGGSNLYSNAVQITNFVSGSQLAGVNSFLQAYSLSSSDLIGLNGTNAATIAQVPLSQLQFSNAIDPTSKLPNSSLNAIALDTNSAVLNQGMVLAGSSLSPDLQTMFDNLWQFQLKTGEAKVNFSLAPTTPPSSPPPPSAPPSELSSENYSGYALDFSLSRGTAVSVNGKGELVFDVAAGTSLTSSSVGTTIPKDLRDGQWHYIVASYLPTYQTYNVEGNITQLPGSVGTATLYIDNKLVASNANILGAHPPINPNDQALLLANNAGGAIDQLAFYDKALTSVDFKANTSGQWPAPSAADALSLLSTTGYGIANQTPDLGTKPGAVNAHWYARNVNPNDALLGTFYSTFTPNGKGGGSWSEASNLNPTPIVQATLPSASRPGSLQDNLVIVVPAASWATSDWILGNDSTTNASFNPSGQHLGSVSVTLTTTSNSGDTSTFTLRPDQVLLGDQTLQSLQPQATVSGVNGATTTDYNYFVPTNLPAFTLLVDKNQLPDGNSYTSASYTFSFIEATGATLTVKPYRGTLSGSISGNKLTGTEMTGPLAVGDLLSAKDDVVAENTFITGIVKPFDPSTKTGTYTVSINQSVATVTPMTVLASVNAAGSDLASVKSQGYATSGEIGASQRYSSTIATAAVIEQAPLQLKYIDSGEILKSSSSAAASSESTGSPAPSFGTSQVVGYFPTNSTTNSTTNGSTTTTTITATRNGWLAIAQPQSINASSNPAGRIWIQYTGQSTVTLTNDIPTKSVASTEQAQAPNTWLNALAQSNFSPDVPNLPLLGAANNPSSSGGLLIQADPTVGWGENFGQTMLVAEINGDHIPDLVIGAPQANGGGLVYIIDGTWIKDNLTTVDGATILNLANPKVIGNYVTVLAPSAAVSSGDSTTVAGFGSALAFNRQTKTLWIGAPNYLSQLNPNDATSLQPVGALYSYQYSPTDWTGSNAIPPILQPWGSGAAYSLATSILGTGGSATSPDLSGTATTIYWGSQFGSAIAVDQASGAMAVSAPGVYAAMVYSGTEGVQEQVANGSMKPSDTYGDGALIKIQLPGTGDLPNVSIANGTNVSTFVDIVNQDQLTQNQKDGETSYMQNLKALQVDNIAKATVYNNQALQVNAVGAVYLFNSSSTSPAPANASSTYYGPNPWNVLGASGFGSSLAFGDLTNTNKSGILAVGADQTGGSGAVYFIDTSSQPQSTLGDNQYLAHLASGLTLYGAQAQDRFGNGLVNLGDTNNDGYDDVLIQAFNASSGAGNGYVLFGSDNLIDSKNVNNLGSGNVAPGSIGDIKRVSGPGFKASILSELGYGLSSNTGQGTFGAGDINGDGLLDIPLGSGPNGSAYLTWGHPYLEAITNLQLDKLASNTGYMLDGLATSTQGSLRSIGDFNGDGYGDFISIEPDEFVNTVRIELGANTEAILADYSYNYYSFTVSADTQVLPAGDINGDGLADLALFLNQNVSSAADGNLGGGSTTGIVYGRNSEQLPIGSAFGLLAPVDPATNAPLASLPSQQISGGESSASPAVIAVGDTLYAAVQGVGDGDTSIWFTSSSDGGSSWSSWSDLSYSNPGFATTAAPSLAFFEQKLYMSFLNPDGELQLASFNPDSPSLSDWSSPATITSSDNASASFTSVYTPQLINQGDALAILWVNATDATAGTLYASVSTTPDQVTTGYRAPSPWSDVQGGSSAATPALAQLGDTLYMAVQSNDGSTIYWTSSSDGGSTWASWQALPDSMTSYEPPSLAVFNNTLYLSFIQQSGEIRITSLTEASTNTWAPAYSPGWSPSAVFASLVTETIEGSEQLALYYVSNETTGSSKDPTRLSYITRSATSDPTSASWSFPYNVNYLAIPNANPQDNVYDPQTASGPLAVVSINGQTVIAYQGGTLSNPSNEIYLATSATPNNGDSWSAQAYTDPNQGTNVGLSTHNGQLILSYTSSSDSDALQLDQLSGSGGSWTPTATTSVPLDDISAESVALLQVGATGLLFAGLNGSERDVAVSFAPNFTKNVSWNAPRQLLERSESNGVGSFSPIKATAAPAATLLGADPVIAVNNGGTINLYSPGSSGSSLILASSFSTSGSDPAISSSVAPGLTTTDTGLALTYTNSDTSVSLERLDFFSLDGEAKDGVILTADGFNASKAGLQWQSTNLNASNSALSTVVGTAPVVVNGNLLLTTIDASTSAVRISAIPNGSDPASTTWLNTTIQLPDGNGGWLISQPDANATSTLIAAGDLDGDGLDDLMLTSDQVAADGSTFTGLRVISGAGSPLALAARNDATAAEQAVQLAPALPVNSPASVAASVSAPGALSLTATKSGLRYGLSASLSDAASLHVRSNSLSSAQQLFSSAIASGSVAWSSTSTPPLSGNPALNTASTFGDLNGDGYNDYFDPDGSIWIASAPEGPVFSLWSIRAAGDVNGNGVDDVLLALTPQGPSYPAQSDGKPSAIYSALIDGALFKVSNNSFNLSDLKAALNPYNSIELFDVTTMSSSDEYQSLQNWFSPIVKYQAPIEIESVQTLVTGNSAFIGSAQTSSYNNSPAPMLVHDASGNLYSITTLVIGGGNNTGILLSNTLLLGVGQNSLDPNAIEVTGIDLTKASPLVAGGKTFPSDSIAPLTPGAAIHDGKLFVAIPSATSGNGYGSATNNIWIAYADLNNSDKPLTEATSWTTYQVQSNGGVSAEYSLLTPTLVSEGERLALYFPSGDEGNNDQNLNIHYLYSNDPTQQTGWGSSFSPTTNTYTGTSSTITIDASLSTTPSTGGWASTSGVIVTSPIAATTYQGRTVLAFRGYGDGTGDNVENGALLLAFAPTAVQRAKANIAGSSSTTDWTLWDTGTTGINTPSIATDQANLYLTYTPWSTSATNAEFFPVALNIDQLAPSKQVTLNSDSLIKAGATYTLPITLQQAGDDTVTNDGNIGMTSPYYAGGYFKDADTQANNIGNAPQSVTPSFIGDALYVTNQIGESAAVAINYSQEEAAFGSNQINQAGFSLAGYSIDGNIDVNGDGFTDVLLSDPSDPAIGVNNQYVLFGGDYLNIASQVGTAGNDTLIGTPLADVIYTLGGADGVQSKGGADVIYTGSGDDQISIADNAFVRIDAGSGFDQLRLQGQAGQSYDFSLNVAAPQYFVGTKLKDIELISSIDYGGNTLSIDAAAINAINPDRVIFLTPDSADVINFSAELKRSQANDINYGGSLWYAYAAPGAAGPSANPTLAYVRVPDGNDAPSWLASQVSVGAQGQAPMLMASLSAPSAVSPGSQPAWASPSMVAGSTNFGDGLTITAYRTSPNSGLARFRISRSGDLSRSQLISYVSSSLNSSSEPGRHHTPVAGLLRLEAGQDAADITVPVDGAAMAELRNGTLSLQVAELDDLGQKQVHLLLDVAPSSAGLRPVLSGLNLQVDVSGKAPSIGFRADINQAASAKGLASTLNLKVLRRQSADSSATDPKTRSQNLVISEGALAKFDQDDLNNGQVELQFELNATTGSIQLQAASSQMNPLLLSKLDPTRKPITVGIDLTTTTLDALPMKEPPGGVVLNKTAVDFTVSADGNGQAKLFLDLTQVGDDLVISEDQNGVRKRKANSLLAYYGIDNVGNLTPLTYNAIHRAGARFYDTDGDGIADFVNLVFLDGGLGDMGPSGDKKIDDPSTAGTVDLGNLTLDVVDNQRTLKPSASQNKEASASLVLNAVLNGRAATSNQIGYVVRDAQDELTFDQIFADLTQLRGRAQTLFSTLESSDFTLAAGTSLSREILLIYGQSVRFFEVVDSSLDLLSNASDPRLQIFTSVGQPNGPVEFSSLSGVSLSLALVTDRDQGLNALIGQEQGLAPILDFTSFTVDQRVVGTYSLAREASLDAVTGFYRALDINGTVWIDPTDHSKGTLTPGQAGTTAAAYGAAALKNMVDSLTGLRVGNRQSTAAVAITLQESSYLAPIAQVNGNTFVAYAQGNQDGIAHFVSLGNGTFGLEDLLGGGDRDFDDQVIGFVFKSVTTVV